MSVGLLTQKRVGGSHRVIVGRRSWYCHPDFCAAAFLQSWAPGQQLALSGYPALTTVQRSGWQYRDPPYGNPAPPAAQVPFWVGIPSLRNTGLPCEICTVRGKSTQKIKFHRGDQISWSVTCPLNVVNSGEANAVTPSHPSDPTPSSPMSQNSQPLPVPATEFLLSCPL